MVWGVHLKSQLLITGRVMGCIECLLWMCSEIIDAMWSPSKYDIVYPLSYLFTFTIAAPHSVLVQLSWPVENLAQGAHQPPFSLPLQGSSSCAEKTAFSTSCTCVTCAFAKQFCLSPSLVLQ